MPFTIPSNSGHHSSNLGQAFAATNIQSVVFRFFRWKSDTIFHIGTEITLSEESPTPPELPVVAPSEVVTDEPTVEVPSDVVTDEPTVEVPSDVVTDEPAVEVLPMVTDEPTVEVPSDVMTDEPTVEVLVDVVIDELKIEPLRPVQDPATTNSSGSSAASLSSSLMESSGLKLLIQFNVLPMRLSKSANP